MFFLHREIHLRLETTRVRMRLEVALIKVIGVTMIALRFLEMKGRGKIKRRHYSGAPGTQWRHSMASCALSSTLAEFLNSQQPTLLADGTFQATNRQAASLEDICAPFCSKTAEQHYFLQPQFRKAQLLGAVSYSVPKPAMLCMTWQRKDITSLSRKCKTAIVDINCSCLHMHWRDRNRLNMPTENADREGCWGKPAEIASIWI